MAQRVFIKVLGFTDVERHALNSMFRLSQERATEYALWTPDAPERPGLALLDGDRVEAAEAARVAQAEGLPVLWVGTSPPEGVARSVSRPLNWPAVVQATDELLAPAPVQPGLDLDLDLDLGAATGDDPDTVPGEQSSRRALIVAADRDDRLYLRARLALAGLPVADEAETGAQMLELMRGARYDVALVYLTLPDVERWVLLKQVTHTDGVLRRLIVCLDQPSWVDRLRVRWSGAMACLSKPLHPGRLQRLLQQV